MTPPQWVPWSFMSQNLAVAPLSIRVHLERPVPRCVEMTLIAQDGCCVVGHAVHPQ